MKAQTAWNPIPRLGEFPHRCFVAQVVLVAVVEDVDVGGRALSPLGLGQLDHVLLHAFDVSAAVRVAVDLLREAGQRDPETVGVLGEDRVDVPHLVQV
jgi:hypothetical protein